MSNSAKKRKWGGARRGSGRPRRDHVFRNSTGSEIVVPKGDFAAVEGFAVVAYPGEHPTVAIGLYLTDIVRNEVRVRVLKGGSK